MSCRSSQACCLHRQLWIADPTEGAIVAIPQLGGLHYRYERRAA